MCAAITLTPTSSGWSSIVIFSQALTVDTLLSLPRWMISGIFFSLIFGAALSVLGDKGKRAIDLISIFNDAVMKIVEWIMYFAPIGIFGIISARIGQAGGFKGFLPELFAVGKYSLTVVLGLSFHAFFVLPLILIIFGTFMIG